MIKWFEEDDPEMREAIRKAQDSLPLFIEKVRRENEIWASLDDEEIAHKLVDVFNDDLDGDEIEFAMVKVFLPFPSGHRGGEHLWLDQPLRFSDDKVTGCLSSDSFAIKELKAGGTLTVPLETVSDWVIIFEDGRGLGGYTFPVLRSQMSPEDRQAFDGEWGEYFDFE